MSLVQHLLEDAEEPGAKRPRTTLDDPEADVPLDEEDAAIPPEVKVLKEKDVPRTCARSDAFRSLGTGLQQFAMLCYMLLFIVLYNLFFFVLYRF